MNNCLDHAVIGIDFLYCNNICVLHHHYILLADYGGRILSSAGYKYSTYFIWNHLYAVQVLIDLLVCIINKLADIVNKFVKRGTTLILVRFETMVNLLRFEKDGVNI